MGVDHVSKIEPCLWFDDRAEEAANFYVSVFSARRATSLGMFAWTGRGTPSVKPSNASGSSNVRPLAMNLPRTSGHCGSSPSST